MTIASFQALRSRPLEALDGRIGDVRGFYFNDEDWKIRYLVTKIRWWFRSRLVLVPAYALERINPNENTISVRLTKLRITRAAPVEFKKPVSEQQHEVGKRLEIMQMPYAPELSAAKREFPSAPIGTDASVAEVAAACGQNPHLRSSEELRRNYTLHARDGKIGRVEDFVIDDDQWQVRYLVVRIGAWFSGKLLLIPPVWVDRMSFEQREVFVRLPSVLIKCAPEYHSGMSIDRAYERRLNDHYSRGLAEGGGAASTSSSKKILSEKIAWRE